MKCVSRIYSPNSPYNNRSIRSLIIRPKRFETIQQYPLNAVWQHFQKNHKIDAKETLKTILSDHPHAYFNFELMQYETHTSESLPDACLDTFSQIRFDLYSDKHGNITNRPTQYNPYNFYALSNSQRSLLSTLIKVVEPRGELSIKIILRTIYLTKDNAYSTLRHRDDQDAILILPFDSFNTQEETNIWGPQGKVIKREGPVMSILCKDYDHQVDIKKGDLSQNANRSVLVIGIVRN